MQSGNFGKYDNQEMFDLVDALARIPMSDEAAMKAACSDIQEKMLTDVPMIPLWYNGLWSQYSNAVWTNWPTESSASPTLPTSWSGYWQLGGLQTLINLQPVPCTINFFSSLPLLLSLQEEGQPLFPSLYSNGRHCATVFCQKVTYLRIDLLPCSDHRLDDPSLYAW